MYSRLREWEIYTLLIKCFIYVLIDTEIYIPVIRSFYPNTDYNIHATAIQLMKFNKRSRIIHNARVFVKNIQYHLFYPIKILAIVHSEYPLNASFVNIIIVDITATECPVWNMYLHIVGCIQYSMEDLYFDNCTAHIGCSNIVSYP